MNLKDRTFRPYHKPDDRIQYIYTESDYPPNLIKRITASIETRLSTLSSTEILFKESTTHYEDSLRQSEYNKKLTYIYIIPQALASNKIVDIKSKSYGLTHRSGKLFLQKSKKKFQVYYTYISQRTTFTITHSIETKSK